MCVFGSLCQARFRGNRCVRPKKATGSADGSVRQAFLSFARFFRASYCVSPLPRLLYLRVTQDRLRPRWQPTGSAASPRTEVRRTDRAGEPRVWQEIV